MTTKTPDHDLNHEVYIDPKDHKEHINHLEVYCDNHPDSLECRVYDD